MFLRGRIMSTLGCALLLVMAAGCTPAPNRPLNEEREPFVEQGRSQELALDFPRAIESYHRALEINPGNSVAHYRLALIYEKGDRDPAAAIYHFQRYLRLRPNSDHASIINQHIVGCKQALARDVALGPVSDEMQNRLEELIETSQGLAAQNKQLTLENRALKARLATLETGGGSSRGEANPTVGTQTSPRPSVSSRTPTLHTVQQGDTYYRIASRYGIRLSDLEAANPGVNPRQLRIGQQLVVPTR
jgi:LysM repeat protein